MYVRIYTDGAPHPHSFINIHLHPASGSHPEDTLPASPSYILPCSSPPPPLPITAGCVAVVVIVIVELPPELTLSRAATFTSTKFRLRVASPPWMRVGLEMTSLPRVVVHSEASEIGKQQSKSKRLMMGQ